jgi:hypothetical protein
LWRERADGRKAVDCAPPPFAIATTTSEEAMLACAHPEATQKAATNNNHRAGLVDALLRAPTQRPGHLARPAHVSDGVRFARDLRAAYVMHEWLEEHFPIVVRASGPADELRAFVSDLRTRSKRVVVEGKRANAATLRFASEKYRDKAKAHAAVHHGQVVVL